ncbi:GTPase Era [Aestuariivirga sp.]|uniref:GTPase Era n=1 Tax=Aestuariivirga sp. TaxID=2650926 RepID=UPI0025C6DD37|nr:GTPase Era [Aestuariivirga sp.]MCA3555803.1 GTPase Era [Aestuariivirga sp.]
MEDASQPDGPTRAGFCAIIGAPNAGKSTLVNELTGSKVSIVSHKVQTTRARIRAIVMEGNAQIVLVDTPGIFTPRRALDRAMVANAWGGAGDADAVVLLVDGRPGLTPEAKEIIAHLAQTRTRPILAINKIDLMPRERLLDVAAEFNGTCPFERTFMVSALTGSGTQDLLTYLARKMPEGPWLYPADQVADVQLRFMAAEMTREVIYARLHEELPYASTVETESWEEQKNGSVKIGQVIYVQRDSQKAIVLGKGGQTIKLLGQKAREEMERQFGRKVHLFLFVKVRENWADDKERLRNMGLDV